MICYKNPVPYNQSQSIETAGLIAKCYLTSAGLCDWNCIAFGYMEWPSYAKTFYNAMTVPTSLLAIVIN